MSSSFQATIEKNEAKLSSFVQFENEMVLYINWTKHNFLCFNCFRT